jgi:tetratricopeptide (TPR) repeat protein
MSSSPRAVFLSYASQDAEAAKTLCDALRAKGIEAWFDQSELRGGDAWDQKIRRQIRECALFMPLISANTNARSEGYFRLEWKLGVDRSHLIADDEAFLFPVAIGAFPDDAARVPDRFRDVQWARLGARDTPESIAARVAKLLDGDGIEAKVDRASATRPGSRRKWSRIVWPAVGVVMALSFAYRPLWHPKREVKQTTAPAASVAEATQLARRAIDETTKLTFKRDDLDVAAGFARQASDLAPSLALAWGARARVEAAWLNRTWDVSAARRQAAQDLARRALALDPDEPNALWSQGIVLRVQGALPEATSVLQHAVKVSPRDNPIRHALASTYALQGRIEDAIALNEETVRMDPRDALAFYILALNHAGINMLKDNDPANVDKALAYLDRALEIEVFGTALLHKAALLAAQKGDVASALATLDGLDSLPLQERTEDRATFYQIWIALLARKPARALDAAARTTSTYYSDRQIAAPVAWMKALAHKQAGRGSVAAEEWRAAETVLRARLHENPNSLMTQAELAISLAMLGRKDEAAKQFARYEATQREQGKPGTLAHVRYYAAQADAKRAVAALKEARKTGAIWFTDAVLARDPWFDALRDKTEFKELLK